MTTRSLIRTSLLTGSLLLSSCAYMQTHKNVEESFQQHIGYELSPNLELYRAGNNYFLAAEKKTLQRHYPAIHDSIFFTDNNEPTYEESGDKPGQAVYKPISYGTAAVLQSSNGYAALDVLSDELKSSDTPWVDQLSSQARRCDIKAEIVGQPITWLDATTSEAPLAAKVLSKLDEIVIDWPGTVLYNVAIPVMAPFVFFHQFLTED